MTSSTRGINDRTRSNRNVGFTRGLGNWYTLGRPGQNGQEFGRQVEQTSHLPAKFLAHSDLGVQRVPVSQTAVAAHIAVADRIQVVDSRAMGRTCHLQQQKDPDKYSGDDEEFYHGTGINDLNAIGTNVGGTVWETVHAGTPRSERPEEIPAGRCDVCSTCRPNSWPILTWASSVYQFPRPRLQPTLRLPIAFRSLIPVPW